MPFPMFSSYLSRIRMVSELRRLIRQKSPLGHTRLIYRPRYGVTPCNYIDKPYIAKTYRVNGLLAVKTESSYL